MGIKKGALPLIVYTDPMTGIEHESPMTLNGIEKLAQAIIHDPQLFRAIVVLINLVLPASYMGNVYTLTEVHLRFLNLIESVNGSAPIGVECNRFRLPPERVVHADIQCISV